MLKLILIIALSPGEIYNCIPIHYGKIAIVLIVYMLSTILHIDSVKSPFMNTSIPRGRPIKSTLCILDVGLCKWYVGKMCCWMCILNKDKGPLCRSESGCKRWKGGGQTNKIIRQVLLTLGLELTPRYRICTVWKIYR